jgi:hypothetical protein
MRWGTPRIFHVFAAHVDETLATTIFRMKLIAALLFVVACGGTQKDVSMEGKDVDLARVAGDWQGEYKGDQSGRTGTVSFSLELGNHIAEGQVMMGGSTPLKIQFVKVKQNQIHGTIEPYTDPSCSCQVATTFDGTLSDDLISGNFETKVSANNQTQTGTWSVSRKH